MSSTAAEDCSLGGDYAGIQAGFSASDGSLIPVPEYLVPESLIEWGQVPSYLEILLSEDAKEDADGAFYLQRQTVTVLPATGCAVDNMDTTKSTEEFTTCSRLLSPSACALDSTDSANGATTWKTETVFSLPEALHRLRISMVIKLSSEEVDSGNCDIVIQSPIRLAMERQTSTVSSGGIIADGGGLDGRTVSLLLGEWLWKKQSKVLSSPVPQVDTLGDTIHLPGNITITKSNRQFTFDIRRGGYGKTSSTTVRRQFSGTQCQIDLVGEP